MPLMHFVPGKRAAVRATCMALCASITMMSDSHESLPLQLEQASLAYENQSFLDSADGRILRILAEYSEPKKTTVS